MRDRVLHIDGDVQVAFAKDVDDVYLVRLEIQMGDSRKEETNGCNFEQLREGVEVIRTEDFV